MALPKPLLKKGWLWHCHSHSGIYNSQTIFPFVSLVQAGWQLGLPNQEGKMIWLSHCQNQRKPPLAIGIARATLFGNWHCQSHPVWQLALPEPVRLAIGIAKATTYLVLHCENVTSHINLSMIFEEITPQNIYPMYFPCPIYSIIMRKRIKVESDLQILIFFQASGKQEIFLASFRQA